MKTLPKTGILWVHPPKCGGTSMAYMLAAAEGAACLQAWEQAKKLGVYGSWHDVGGLHDFPREPVQGLKVVTMYRKPAKVMESCYRYCVQKGWFVGTAMEWLENKPWKYAGLSHFKAAKGFAGYHRFADEVIDLENNGPQYHLNKSTHEYTFTPEEKEIARAIWMNRIVQ